jgi:aspartate-semialdehyde dehydrogenase
VNIELEKDFDENVVREMLSNTSGIVVVDNPAMNAYPTPIDAAGKDEVFVGRIRRDYSQPNTLNCWIVSDNLRKGAATNAVQIAKYLHNQGWIN